jgi:hypothetical protein
VEDVTDTAINISFASGNETAYQELNRTITFNKTTELTRLFYDVPLEYIEDDIEELGYSFHELAGTTLYFRVKLLQIHRVS